MIEDEIELDNKINAVIKYCQKNSIDKYAIDTYSKDVFANGVTDMYIFKSASNNYAYCSYMYDLNSYIFRLKDVETLLAFYDLYIHTGWEILQISNSKDVIKNNYKFDYEKNEITTVINGHCLKSCAIDTCGEPPKFYTFDADSKNVLMQINIFGGIALYDDMYRLLNLKVPEHEHELEPYYEPMPITTYIKPDEVPDKLKTLVQTQSVLLSLSEGINYE